MLWTITILVVILAAIVGVLICYKTSLNWALIHYNTRLNNKGYRAKRSKSVPAGHQTQPSDMSSLAAAVPSEYGKKVSVGEGFGKKNPSEKPLDKSSQYDKYDKEGEAERLRKAKPYTPGRGRSK